MAKSNKNLVGGWAFLIGVVLALVIGVLDKMSPTWLYILVALGLIIGILNITGKETNAFMLSGVTLIIASALGQYVMSEVPELNNVLQALLAIFVPAIIIVSVRNVFILAKD